MIKHYEISADGETANLHVALSSVDGITVAKLGDYVCVTVPEENRPAYVEAVRIVEECSHSDNIDFAFNFIASDFTPEDLKGADALLAELRSVPREGDSSIHVAGENEVASIDACSECGYETLQPSGHGCLSLTTQGFSSSPFFMTESGISVFRGDVIRQLDEINALEEVTVIQCKALDAPLSGDGYFALFPRRDLGDPIGEIELGESCATCGHRALRNKREFLWTFGRPEFRSVQMALTSWFSRGALIVSPQVYELCERFMDENDSFKPVQLI